MKITPKKLRQIIKEEMSSTTEVDEKSVGNYCIRKGDSVSSITDRFSPKGVTWQMNAKLNNLKAPYTIHPKDNLKIWVTPDYEGEANCPQVTPSDDIDDWADRVPAAPLYEAIMVSLNPVTDRPEPTQKSRWAKLSGIPEEHINLSESIMDATSLDDLVGTMVGEFTDRMRDMAGEIVDRFGNEMGRLWDEDPAMMREQGYADKSQWTRQVGSAEIALENELQQIMKSDDEQEDELYQAIKQAVEEVETRLHDGQFYDERDSRSSMGSRDSNSDGKLDADELRDIADDLEGSNPQNAPQNEGTTLEQMPATWRQVLKTCLKDKK